MAERLPDAHLGVEVPTSANAVRVAASARWISAVANRVDEAGSPVLMPAIRNDYFLIVLAFAYGLNIRSEVVSVCHTPESSMVAFQSATLAS